MNAALKSPWVEIAPGIRRQTIINGARMYQMRAELKAGSRLPEHHHPQEQITHLLAGRIRLIVAGVPHELTAGDSFYIGNDVPHRAETIEESKQLSRSGSHLYVTKVLDTFSPPREDYLAADEQARAL